MNWLDLRYQDPILKIWLQLLSQNEGDVHNGSPNLNEDMIIEVVIAIYLKQL